MSTLLRYIPDAWGPKLDADSGAVARTRIGPNEIAFKAPAHMALVMFTPQPNREVALNSDRKTITLAPVGAIELIPAQAELFARWRVSKENLLIALDQERLAQLAREEFDSEDFELRPPKPGYLDQQALLLANLIREEFQRRESANRLSVDALITLFANHLLRSYSTFGDRPMRLFRGGLSPRAWRRVTEYIHAHLCDDLSVGRLAQIAGLSPSHFLRAFHQSAGEAPHRYVLAQRLALAERLAKTTDIPFARVATAAGFSSNSHMTATMKRLWGLTPSELRREERRWR